MPRFLCDTTCMIAAASSWQPRHRSVLGEIGRTLDAGKDLMLAGPSLVEAYSVLTRHPVPNLLTSDHCLAVLDANFVSRATETIGLPGHEYVRLVTDVSRRGVVGGATYDAVIVACAVAGGVDVLLTLNERHFRPLAPAGLEIVAPL